MKIKVYRGKVKHGKSEIKGKEFRFAEKNGKVFPCDPEFPLTTLTIGKIGASQIEKINNIRIKENIVNDKQI